MRWKIENMDGDFSFWLTYQSISIFPAKDHYKELIDWLESNQPVLSVSDVAALRALPRAADRATYINEHMRMGTDGNTKTPQTQARPQTDHMHLSNLPT